jgi:hypothetical protein
VLLIDLDSKFDLLRLLQILGQHLGHNGARAATP